MPPLHEVSTLDRLVRDDPDLHAWGDGTRANWSVSADVLRFLHGCLAPGMRTLETGAGQSTVVFAIAGTEHVCITPNRGDAERIRAYCDATGVPTDGVTFIHESSDRALPAGRGIPTELDFVFIDGAHRFPFAALDWHYTQDRLRVGGIVAVDDCTMPSVRILHDFLDGEDEWDLIEIVGRTSFFRRTAETVIINDCQGQKMNRVPYPRVWPG